MLFEVAASCYCSVPELLIYEGRLISNAHSEISRKRDHIFKQTKVKYNIVATN